MVELEAFLVSFSIWTVYFRFPEKVGSSVWPSVWVCVCDETFVIMVNWRLMNSTSETPSVPESLF